MNVFSGRGEDIAGACRTVSDRAISHRNRALLRRGSVLEEATKLAGDIRREQSGVQFGMSLDSERASTAFGSKNAPGRALAEGEAGMPIRAGIVASMNLTHAAQ